ncbi:MAG: DUF1449 family protein [Crocinitomix sp.]|nr:DUF1449 family protein [Crocinitomix sp.]
MSEFLSHIFSLPNLFPTFILCFCVLYWLIVIVGIIDLDMIDVDVDVDVDVDADVDVTGGTEVGVAWFNKVLHFFNLGRFPFMIWLSIVSLMSWFATIMVNRLLHIDSFLIGTAFFLIAFIAAMFAAKPLTFPLVKMFDAMEKSDGLKSVIGQLADVLYPNKGTIPGEVEINYEGSKIRIFVLPATKDDVLIKNQKVLVIAPSDEDAKIFLVEPYN